METLNHRGWVKDNCGEGCRQKMVIMMILSRWFIPTMSLTLNTSNLNFLPIPGSEDKEMENPEEMKAKMSSAEWKVIYNMTNNRDLYTDLIR